MLDLSFLTHLRPILFLWIFTAHWLSTVLLLKRSSMLNYFCLLITSIILNETKYIFFLVTWIILCHRLLLYLLHFNLNILFFSFYVILYILLWTFSCFHLYNYLIVSLIFVLLLLLYCLLNFRSYSYGAFNLFSQLYVLLTIKISVHSQIPLIQLVGIFSF